MGDNRAVLFGDIGKGVQYLDDLLIIKLQRHSVVSVYTSHNNNSHVVIMIIVDSCTLVWCHYSFESFGVMIVKH